MSKKAGIIFVTIGAVLMLSALLLLVYNGYEERRAGQEAELLLADILSVIEEQTDTSVQTTEIRFETTESTGTEKILSTAAHSTETLSSETLPAELPVVMIDGYEYIGYLSIPELELELPIMSEWDYKRLKISPCRHFGSSRTDDLVIAAHNYKTHFGLLSQLENGAEICFTDMDGVVNDYTLVKLEILEADSVEAVLNSGYDLVLYTCTTGGAARVVAFCDRAADGTDEEGTGGKDTGGEDTDGKDTG